jgi:hypothetical protein
MDTNPTATTVAVCAFNENTGVFEAIETHPIRQDSERDLSGVQLSAFDFGGNVGETYRVELCDEEGRVVDSVEVVAQ